MNQELFSQFLSLLEASSSFKLLSPEQQVAIKTNYENATDEQLNQGIFALKEDQEAIAKLEAERKNDEEELEKKSVEVKGVLRGIKNDERKEAEAADSADDKKEMAGVLQQMDSMGLPTTEAPKKRKKFLGIF